MAVSSVMTTKKLGRDGGAKWRTPRQERLKHNTDASLRAGWGAGVGVGGVLRDEGGGCCGVLVRDVAQLMLAYCY